MKTCEKCKISVPDPKRRCPLCQGMLSGGDGTETDTFPQIPTIYRQYSLYFRLLILVSVAAGLISVMVNLLLPQTGWWSLIVVLGILCMWIPLWTAIRKKAIYQKTLSGRLFAVGSDCGLGRIYGWHRWSVNFVIPPSAFPRCSALQLWAR